ncbi:vacuolar fusion protein CCZ1 homolog [Macrosteles quadrilineatus]|uniref:vacuolar fusion protein CCZ1 homolog n=1 Tax=Macrosteles quadrilineatus TaxID=74068 RepID=UPI0023E22998|nr:vacuolar fusion protein CCZ1 homolog [Macrosteles quadrilineatus]
MMSDLSLKYFYVYNDSYGNVEGEEDQKIMYYFPPKVNIDEKMKNVGLSEAIIKFTETFNPTQPCESLHTEKTRHYYYNPEPDFYLVMVVNVPTETSIEGTKYHGEDVQDSVCLAVVRQAYHMYRLFHNTLTDTLESNSRDTTHLKQKLELYFNTYLTTLNLQNCDIMDVFQGVKFLPLDKQTFLHIQCFVNLLEATFPVVEFTSFFYNDSLIWSGLEPEDMQVVYRYLVSSVLSEKILESDVYNGILQTTPISSYGRFLTGPENVHSNTNSVGKVPKVFLSQIKPLPAMYHLVVYRLGCCVVCLFIPEYEQLTMEMFRKWDTFLGPRLTKLVPEVSSVKRSQANAAATSADTVNRFVYFNRMNLATKSTIHCNGKLSSDVTVSPQVLRLLAEINAQHARLSAAGSSSAETIVKTTMDHWVVGKLSNAREFFVVIQQKNANLIEISDEVKRISENELKNIYFNV